MFSNVVEHLSRDDPQIIRGCGAVLKIVKKPVQRDQHPPDFFECGGATAFKLGRAVHGQSIWLRVHSDIYGREYPENRIHSRQAEHLFNQRSQPGQIKPSTGTQLFHGSDNRAKAT